VAPLTRRRARVGPVLTLTGKCDRSRVDMGTPLTKGPWIAQRQPSSGAMYFTSDSRTWAQ
jgi:hypothetical protein